MILNLGHLLGALTAIACALSARSLEIWLRPILVVGRSLEKWKNHQHRMTETKTQIRSYFLGYLTLTLYLVILDVILIFPSSIL